MRLTNPETIDKKAIRSLVAAGNAVTVQFSQQLYTKATLAALNELCKELDDNLCIRFYGHYGNAFDCSNLKHIVAVKNLNLDCLHAVVNFDIVRQLEHLSRLNIGIFELSEADFLSWPNLRGLTNLCLSESRKNNIDLNYLSGYSGLDTLFLNGHVKNVESIGALRKITRLSLSIPSKTSITFLNNLPELKKLRFILGGRLNLDDLENYLIEELEIVRVRGFNEFSNLGKFHALKKLVIEDQIQIHHVDFGTELSELTDLKFVNCKNLESVFGLSSLRSLNELRIFKTNIDFEDFMQQERPESLKILAFYTTKKAKDLAIKERLTALGYADGLPQRS